MTDANVSELVGKVLVSVDGMISGSDEIIFTCKDGDIYRMYHDQRCCEIVDIDDVIGSPKDLTYAVIVMAEEVSNKNAPPPCNGNQPSYTWTFYKFATVRGYVTVKWYGESNGYYSESVDFCKLN